MRTSKRLLSMVLPLLMLLPAALPAQAEGGGYAWLPTDGAGGYGAVSTPVASAWDPGYGGWNPGNPGGSQGGIWYPDNPGGWQGGGAWIPDTPNYSDWGGGSTYTPWNDRHGSDPDWGRGGNYTPIPGPGYTYPNPNPGQSGGTRSRQWTQPECVVGSAKLVNPDNPCSRYSLINMRGGPSKSYRVIGQYRVGTWVDVIEYGRIWWRVRVGGQTGYIMAYYLSQR